MGRAKEKVIAKILSFTYEELAQWIRSRLHGKDRYFSIYVGHETNLSGFIANAFRHINNQDFRDNFIMILNALIFEVNRYTTEEIEDNKEYIYELFTLPRCIKKYEAKGILFEMARSGKFKGVRVHDTDLHLVLLATLSSYRIGGNYRFWIDQMQDDSNIYYTNAAFYALLENGYSLDILFKHIGTFIDRFNGRIELVFAVESLFDDREPGEIISRFKSIESQLTVEQREAVDNALVRVGYDKVFEPVRIPVTHQGKSREVEIPSRIASPVPPYSASESIPSTQPERYKKSGHFKPGTDEAELDNMSTLIEDLEVRICKLADEVEVLRKDILWIKKKGTVRTNAAK